MSVNFYIRKIKLKSGKTRYRSVITISSRDVKSKTFDRIADAKRWGERLKSQHQQDEANGINRCNVTFIQLCNEYMSAWTGKDHDRARMVTVWRNKFNTLTLDRIDSGIIREALREYKSLAPATYNKHRGQLSSLFKFAIECHHESNETYITANPVDSIPALPLNNMVVRYLSDEERPRLISACKAIGGKFYLYFLVAIGSGMRKSEILNLRWNNIDWKQGVAILHDTKNGQPRHTPLAQPVLDALKPYRGIGSALIFPCSTDHNKPASYQRQWTQAKTDAGINDFRFHDLRHDVASTMAANGHSLIEIGAVLGHKSPSSTARYAHLSTQSKSDALNTALNKTLAGI